MDFDIQDERDFKLGSSFLVWLDVLETWQTVLFIKSIVKAYFILKDISIDISKFTRTDVFL